MHQANELNRFSSRFDSSSTTPPHGPLSVPLSNNPRPLSQPSQPSTISCSRHLFTSFPPLILPLTSTTDSATYSVPQTTLQITASQVMRELERLNQGKAAGPDGVSPRVLKANSTDLSHYEGDVETDVDIYLDNKLEWSTNTGAIYKKGLSRLYFLRRLRSFNTDITAKDTVRVNKLVKKAGSVVGSMFANLKEVVEDRMLTKLLIFMDNRKRPAASSHSRSLAYSVFSFLSQPARILIVDALPPWWSETCTVLCDALDNVLSLACSLEGPCRMPLLSLYAVSRQQECLLPFVQVRGNLARLHSCIEELRSIPGDGCIRGPSKGGELLKQAVLDSLQQFKQYIRHTSAGNQTSDNTSVEVTVVTSQPGRGIVCQLEMGLKDADLVSLRRLLVVQINSADNWGQDISSPEATHTEAEDCLMLGMEVDLQQVDNTVFALETVLKAWLQEQGGDREHLQLLLPNQQEKCKPVCVKCDMQERLISPALLPLDPHLGARTETVNSFLPLNKGPVNQKPPVQRLKVIRALRADGLCESLLFGLPLVIRPTTCWQLDWDEMETNHNLFHALCHTLRIRDLFLLLQMDPAGGSGVHSHYVLQPSPSLSLLVKPIVSRELLLPCSMLASTQDPTPDAVQVIQGCLSQLDEDTVFSPLSLNTNLYQYLRSRGLLSQPRYPYRLQPISNRTQLQPLEGGKAAVSRQQRQPPNQGRQLGMNSKVRATVAPLPSTSSHAASSLVPPPAKASRPALTFHSSSSHRALGVTPHRLDVQGHNNDSDNDDLMVIL
ncbi:meiosis 1 arrest protein [Thalassophryne amazonica]|uniref:meiosis 1 arrest protein n=1 Tax=Thalassophryne amazonica TaxID=390379 RepID=UPI00147226B4|nr:meiosis 1 arrest protein [Thalassophryne amazonica]